MKKIPSIIILLAVLFVGPMQVEATKPLLSQERNYYPEQEEAISAFQNVIMVSPVDILVPTVVAVPLREKVVSGEQFLVRERETGSYVGSYLKQKTANRVALWAQTVPSLPASSRLVDSNLNTYAEFPVPSEGQGVVKILITSMQPITTSVLNLHLAQYVALPLTVEIEAGQRGISALKTVVAKKKINSSRITFPETTATQFEVTLTYAQPLRINELDFVQKNATLTTDQELRFLAQPSRSYDVYYKADRKVSVALVESGNLRIDEGVLTLSSYPSQKNQLYIPADVDEDGVRDTADNCVRNPNPDQADIDGNGRGDVCDDYDKDGRINSEDNCINNPNARQEDEDGDGIGDVCDEEESRFTERNPWVPWVGMGTAATVILLLFILVAKGTKREDEEGEGGESNSDNNDGEGTGE